MKEPAQIIQEHVLATLPKEPLKKQAELYGALAKLAATPEERKRLNAEAATCRRLARENEAHARRHEQLVIDFRLRAL